MTGGRASPMFALSGTGAAWSSTRPSIDDKKLGPHLRVGAVGLCIVCDLVARAGLEREPAPILKLRVQFTLGAKEDVPLDAPVIRQVAGRVLDHADADRPEVPGAPVGESTFTLVFGPLDAGPIRRTERNS